MLFVLPRMDATLKELTSLVKEVYPEARKKGTHFSFSIVYPDPRGKVYRSVSYDSGTDGKQVRVKHCRFKLIRSSQVERYWQHRVRQEGCGRLPDITVAALPDRRLPRHRYHAAQQSPAPQHTHEALLNRLMPTGVRHPVNVDFSFFRFIFLCIILDCFCLIW